MKKYLQNQKKTNIEKLGVEYPFQNKDILKKCVDSSIEKHGIDYRATTISKQQRYLYNIFGGILNYSEFPFYLDIFFKEERIYLEYDGSGHRLSIKYGKLTSEEFEKQEVIRSIFLKEKGYKEFRILSSDDVLPSKKELLKIKEKAFIILKIKQYNTYIYNLNTKTESFRE
jgi:hypothetical protein